MKTKVLLLGAALAMTTAIASAQTSAIASAQTYSSNVVGYVNVDLVPGWNLIANPLDAGVDGEGNDMNTLSSLLSNVPVGTAAYKYVDGTYISSEYSELMGYAYWTDDFSLKPGEGVFLNIDSAATVTFVGEVVVGNHSVDIPAGWSIISNPIPVAGTVSTLGLDSIVEVGDSIYIYDNGYIPSEYSELMGYTFWTEDFNISVGQAFFINKANPATWTKTFEF